jgi:hypothetical protein
MRSIRILWNFSCLISFICLLGLLSSSFHASADKPKDTPIPSEIIIKDAIASVGFDAKKVTVVESQMTPKEQQIPCLATPESVLRIRIHTGPLEAKSGHNNSQIQSWDLFYSLQTKQVIKAVSVWPKDDDGIRFPPIDKQEKELKQMGETFVDLPTSASRVNLTDSIKSAEAVADAKQIIALMLSKSSPIT